MQKTLFPKQVHIIQKRIEPSYSPLVRHGLKEPGTVALLPEYFNFGQSWRDIEEGVEAGQRELDYLRNLSARHGNLIVAGSVVEKESVNGIPFYFNRSHVLYEGRDLGFFSKINLYKDERKILTAGTEPVILDTPMGWISILICADVLIPGIFESIQAEAARSGRYPLRAIFCPTTSPRKNESEQTRRERDQQIYGRAAVVCQCPILKSCAVGEIRGNRVQGRSLAAYANGTILNAGDIDSEEILQIKI